MKKFSCFFFISVFLMSCETTVSYESSDGNSTETTKEEITTTLDKWHKAAAKADFESYFSFLTEDAVYIGTDATENWDKAAFKAYAKPHFERGKVWKFYDLERSIHLSENGKTAWFDELLKTQMGLCRGSGVLEKVGNEWKIKHYVLSMTIPNGNIAEVTRMKREFDRDLLEKRAAQKK